MREKNNEDLFTYNEQQTNNMTNCSVQQTSTDLLISTARRQEGEKTEQRGGALFESEQGRNYWLVLLLTDNHPCPERYPHPIMSTRTVVPNLGPPDVLGLQFPEILASRGGEGFWEL